MIASSWHFVHIDNLISEQLREKGHFISQNLAEIDNFTSQCLREGSTIVLLVHALVLCASDLNHRLWGLLFYESTWYDLRGWLGVKNQLSISIYLYIYFTTVACRIFNMRTNLGACRAHKWESGINKSAQKLTRRDWKTSFQSPARGSNPGSSD